MKKKMLILFIIIICIVAIRIAYSYNGNNIDMENSNKKYNINDVKKDDQSTMVSFGDVATSDKLDIQIVESSEKMEIKTKKNIYTPNPNNKFIIVKFKVKNSSNSTYEVYRYDFSLINMQTKENYTSFTSDQQIICKFLNETSTGTGDIKPGIIRDTYILFQIPKECKIDNLVLKHYDTLFKINSND